MTTFFCVNDGVPEETTRLLAQACASRGIDCVEIHAPAFDYAGRQRLAPGTLLYRPGISVAAMRVEQFLFAPGVSTFHADPEGPFFECNASPLIFQRHRLPIPRTIPVHASDRDLLRGFVTELGGLPVVVKVGGSGGIGTMRADSLPALFSLLDHLLNDGQLPALSAYVGDAVHWRVVVVGDRAVAAYRNLQEDDDFRSYGSEDARDFTADVPARLARIAIAAVRALRLEFGGIDLLEHPSGRLYLLEANFPCYFAQAQLYAGIDVAGAMLDHLIAKRERLAVGGFSAERSAPPPG